MENIIYYHLTYACFKIHEILRYKSIFIVMVQNKMESLSDSVVYVVGLCVKIIWSVTVNGSSLAHVINSRKPYSLTTEGRWDSIRPITIIDLLDCKKKSLERALTLTHLSN